MSNFWGAVQVSDDLFAAAANLFLSFIRCYCFLKIAYAGKRRGGGQLCLTDKTCVYQSELMPPPAAQKAMRLLFGTLRLGFLLKNNPFLEKEAAATLQYVGYTSPLNMSGNPAMSVPLYRHHGLPVGTQFAAAHGREDTLLRLAAQLEQIQPWVEIPQVV